MDNTCENCGSKVYDGHCTWCHEETYIYEQNQQNDEMISFSDEFLDKVEQQEKEAQEIRMVTVKEKEEEKCQICGILKSESEDWNEYYKACESCF